MFDETGTLGIVFNGEIYNYRALRRELECRGYRFKSTSDTEVLLHLYSDRGAKMLDSLRGMYAFAIWDQRNRGLFLARDPYGIKPLYYSDNGETFRAASQVKALLASKKLDTTPGSSRACGVFPLGTRSGSPYALSRHPRCSSGKFNLVTRGKKQTDRQLLQPSEDFRGRRRDARRSCSDIVKQALHDTGAPSPYRDVPVGVFLSSGVDSTTIAALAAEEGGSLKTITLGFEEYAGTARTKRR
jgi:asparagine synthase (glutamine-hydrolysing)